MAAVATAPAIRTNTRTSSPRPGAAEISRTDEARIHAGHGEDILGDVYCVDVDLDGLEDIVIITGLRVPAIHWNEGGYKFSSSNPSSQGMRLTVVGDFNGDGKTDYAAFNLLDELVVFINEGGRTFRRMPDAFVVDAAGTSLNDSTWVAADLEEDGDLDIVVTNPLLDEIIVLRNDGSGEFYRGLRFPFGIRPSTLVSGDYDGDGRVDIVGVSPADEALIFARNVRSQISLDCDHDGRFDACEIASGSAVDCNRNGIPDQCEIEQDRDRDCNKNTVPDECDVLLR